MSYLEALKNVGVQHFPGRTWPKDEFNKAVWMSFSSNLKEIRAKSALLKELK